MPSNKPRNVVFIDRDGVINEDPIGDYVKHRDDFRFIPGSIEALKRLNESGFDIVIVSNQAGIGDGVFTKSALREVTDHMLAELKKHKIQIKGIYYCVHGKEANCECRKPKTGLFQQAAKDIAFNPSETYFVGDKASDMQAGRNFGLRTLFVLTGHGTKDRPRLKPNESPEQIFSSLGEATDYILLKKSR